MASEEPLRMAILDDNLSISAPHFSAIDTTKVSIIVYKDTLPPYSHASTSDSDRQRLVDRLKPYHIISTMRERTAIPGDLMRQLPHLKLLLVTGVRHGCFDLAAAKELGITVAAAPGYSIAGRGGGGLSPMQRELSQGGAHATTQHTWALILGLARGVAREDQSMRHGGWQERAAVPLAGRTLGVIGMGRLGASTARIGALAFGMKVICWSSNLTQEKADQIARDYGMPVEIEGERVFEVVDKEKLFRDADIVTLHYPLSERSRGMVGRKELELMKETASFINTSRGPLVDEQVLLEILEKGAIMGAAFDVYDVEPLPKNHPLRSSKWGTEGRSEVLLSPHMGYVEEQTLSGFYEETAENLERWLSGQEPIVRLA